MDVHSHDGQGGQEDGSMLFLLCVISALAQGEIRCCFCFHVKVFKSRKNHTKYSLNSVP